MAGQVFEFSDLRPFIRHEIGEMQRFQEDKRKITIMFLRHQEGDRMLKALKDSLRTSDAVFRKSDAFFVVMAATDKEGAMHVARILEDYFEHSIADVNATWPEDGATEGELLASLSQYIRSKCDLDLLDIIR
ncbi:MAG: GGDEF domain-containing protein [Helicobacteraceae bacterium]|jgi:hypothetical protein|nr:GGDEF domain-containing protein [Helicobacteraceae bacterium]